ncbi:MAG: rod shape-determining protein MreD [Planctomycetota bacterium]|nr:rod shape-determining protein MreD [Planctomycetota bacterium]
MKGLSLIGSIIGPLWLFQGRSNFVALCGSWPYLPDLVLLGVVLVACRAAAWPAVAFAVVSGLLADVSVDVNFGAHAFVNAFMVAVLLLPSRRIFYYDSKLSVFLAVFSFALVQKAGFALYLAPSGSFLDWFPRVFLVCLVTALASVPLKALFDIFLSPSEDHPKKRKRRAFRK